jgi:hypothetical protein
MEIIASQMVSESRNSLQLESMGLLKGLCNGFWGLGCNEKIIHVNCHIFIVILALPHPYAPLSLALHES